MSVEKMDRRQFMQQAGTLGLVGVAVAGGMSVLSGCGGDKKAEAPAAAGHDAIKAAHEAADPCNDLSGLSKAEVATRTTFKYKSSSEDPTKVCNTCNFWQPSADGALCGTCTLVKGPINPLATCMSWVVKPKT